MKRKRELDEVEAKVRAQRDSLAKAPREDPPSGTGGGKRGIRLPQHLLGKEVKTTVGQSHSFAHNLGNCEPKVASGARCDKGYHVCMELVNGHACGLPHTVAEHRSTVR